MNRNLEFWPLAHVGSALAGIAFLLAPLSAQAESNPYYVSFVESISRDNNLIKLADGVAAPDGYSRSDTAMSTSLVTGVNQGFGRQRAYADFSLRDLRYRANSRFNNQGYTGRIGLDWSSAERVSGSLLATANRSLMGFNTYGVGLLNQKNYEDTQGLTGNVSVGLVTRYSLDFSASHRQVTHTLDSPLVQARNFLQDTGGLTLYWRPSGATRVGLGLSETRGRYPKFRQVADGFEADRYKRQGLELSASLRPTGASSLNMRLGQSRTSYDLNQARNFSGFTGALAWNWQASGKLRLNTSLSRDTGQDSYAVTVFDDVPGTSDTSRLVNTLRFEATFEQTAKLKFVGSAQVAQRTVVRTIVNPLAPLNADGKDNTVSLGLGARWAVLRTASLGCDLRSTVRTTSGQLIAPMHSSGYSCFGQLQFQP